MGGAGGNAPNAREESGVWIDANPVEGCVVVNVGEMVRAQID